MAAACVTYLLVYLEASIFTSLFYLPFIQYISFSSFFILFLVSAFLLSIIQLCPPLVCHLILSSFSLNRSSCVRLSRCLIVCLFALVFVKPALKFSCPFFSLALLRSAVCIFVCTFCWSQWQDIFGVVAGELYMKMNNDKMAEHWYREALKSKPDHIPAHLTLARLFMHRVNFDFQLIPS